jgi:hypothetical protein
MNMKYLGFILVLGFFSSLAAAQFRDTTWGMTKEQVIAIESATFIQETPSGTVIYSSSVGGLDAYIAYDFLKTGELVRGNYIFFEEHSNNYGHVEDFDKIQGILEDLYGDIEVTEIWTDDLFKDDKGNWGTAIGYGSLAMFAEWITADTKVQHGISGENFNISHGISYTALVYQEQWDNEQKQKDSEGF